MARHPDENDEAFTDSWREGSTPKYTPTDRSATGVSAGQSSDGGLKNCPECGYLMCAEYGECPKCGAEQE